MQDIASTTRRRLGRDGPTVGAVALGSMSFGGMYGATDRRESHATLARALELGVDHIDTSNVYGDGVSEEVIGSFLKDNPGAGFTIATKAGIEPRPVRHYDNSPDYLRACLEASLKRLGVAHVSLFYIHRRDPSRPIEEVMETMARFKQEGKIGAIGLSEVAPSTLERASAVHPVAAVQSEYSLWTRQPELGLVQACARYGAALVGFSALGRGMLTGTLRDVSSMPANDFRNGNPRFTEPNFQANLKRVDRFVAIAREMGHPPAALAIAWLLSRAPHVIALPGTRNADHLAECAAGRDIKLTASDLEAIEEALPIGSTHGDRYAPEQYGTVERYC